MATARKLIRDEFDRTYRFRDDVVLDAEPATNESTAKNVFDTLPAYRETAMFGEFDDLTRYLGNMVEDVKNEDLLRWWYEHKHIYPHLYRMALDYHTVPCKRAFLVLWCITNIISGTSVDVERVFSQGRLLLPYVCNRLSSESTRALLCLGDWSRRSFVKDGDIKAAAILPDVIGPEPRLASGWDDIA